MPAALASSTARRAPFSLSLPRCAMPPVSGPTWPILTSAADAAGAWPASPFLAPVCGVSLLHPAMASAAASSEKASLVFFMGSPRGLAFGGAYLTSAPPRKSTVRLLLRHDPLHERLDVGVRDLRVRRHRHLAPDPLAAFLHLVEKLRLGTRVIAVFRRHLLVGVAEQLLVRGVAGEAIVLLREFLLGVRGQRRGCRQGEEQCGLFHGFSLHAAFHCMRSLIGARHLTPRHGQHLTGCGRRGLSRGAGTRSTPSGSDSTRPSGRYSRASSSRQRSSSGPPPRSTTSFGGASSVSASSVANAKSRGENSACISSSSAAIRNA